MLLTAGAIFVLLIMSAFFSGSETALTAASKPMLHQLEQGGNRRAGLINRMLVKKERLIGAILLGNNLVNILAASIATIIGLRLGQDSGVAIATIVLTFVILIYSEVTV